MRLCDKTISVCALATTLSVLIPNKAWPCVTRREWCSVKGMATLQTAASCLLVFSSLFTAVLRTDREKLIFFRYSVEEQLMVYNRYTYAEVKRAILSKLRLSVPYRNLLAQCNLPSAPYVLVFAISACCAAFDDVWTVVGWLWW